VYVDVLLFSVMVEHSRSVLQTGQVVLKLWKENNESRFTFNSHVCFLPLRKKLVAIVIDINLTQCSRKMEVSTAESSEG
jgi:two-component SAPR family response regulator